ncbi:MAG: response regulator [candidate division FCPU426 bacterium]
MAKILIVDDHERFLQTMHFALEDLHEVQTARGAEEALRCMEEACPQLVMTDYMMPDMDGLEFIEKMQGHHCSPKVMLVSAYLNHAVIIRARALGASDCVDKPFDLHDLRDRIDRALSS